MYVWDSSCTRVLQRVIAGDVVADKHGPAVQPRGNVIATSILSRESNGRGRTHDHRGPCRALRSVRQEQEVMHVLGDDLFDEHADSGALAEVVGEMTSGTVGRHRVAEQSNGIDAGYSLLASHGPRNVATAHLINV